MISRLALSSFLLVVAAEGAVVQSIDKDLVYARISDLGQDAKELEAALAKPDLILDLRNAKGTAEAARQLLERLSQPPNNPTDHRLILLNPDSAPEIVSAASKPQPRQLTVGPQSPTLHTDIEVPTSVETDERAYVALGAGTPLEKLIDSNPEKKRYDEAALARSRTMAAEAADEESEEVPSTPNPSASEAVKKPSPAAIHDLVLERAVQIHEGLVAEQSQPVVPPQK